jgi:hypothetical protein
MLSSPPLDFFSHRQSELTKNDEQRSTWRKYLVVYYYHCRETVEQCQSATNTTGDVFNIEFTIKYPIKCLQKSCKQNFLSEIESLMKNVIYKLNLTITFTDGQTINSQTIFCSFDTIDNGKLLEFSHNNSSDMLLCFYWYAYR